VCTVGTVSRPQDPAGITVQPKVEGDIVMHRGGRHLRIALGGLELDEDRRPITRTDTTRKTIRVEDRNLTLNRFRISRLRVGFWTEYSSRIRALDAQTETTQPPIAREG